MIIGPICIWGLLFCCHLPRVIEGVCVVILARIIVFIFIGWQLLGSWIWSSLVERVLRAVFSHVSLIIAIISWASTSTFAFLPQGRIFPAHHCALVGHRLLVAFTYNRWIFFFCNGLMYVLCLVFSVISPVILVFRWGTCASAFLAQWRIFTNIGVTSWVIGGWVLLLLVLFLKWLRQKCLFWFYILQILVWLLSKSAPKIQLSRHLTTELLWGFIAIGMPRL